MYFKLTLLAFLFYCEQKTWCDSIGGPNLKINSGQNSIKVPPCKLCKILTESFQKVAINLKFNDNHNIILI